MASTSYSHELIWYHVSEKGKIEPLEDDQLCSAPTLKEVQKALRFRQPTTEKVKLDPQKCKIDDSVEYLGCSLQRVTIHTNTRWILRRQTRH